jgi:hypothetical protein
MFKALAIILFSCLSSVALASPGGVDKNGCHGKTAATHHCHDGDGPNAKALKVQQAAEKERRAGHKLACGLRSMGGRPSRDAAGVPCA